jgi:hypothetical protein
MYRILIGIVSSFYGLCRDQHFCGYFWDYRACKKWLGPAHAFGNLQLHGANANKFWNAFRYGSINA